MFQKLESFISLTIYFKLSFVPPIITELIYRQVVYWRHRSTKCDKAKRKFCFCLSKDWYLYNDTTFCRGGMEKWKIIYYSKFFFSFVLRFVENFFKIKYSKLDFAVMWCLSKLPMTPTVGCVKQLLFNEQAVLSKKDFHDKITNY